MSRSSSDCATGRCRNTSSIRFTPRPEGRPGLRAPGTKRGRRAAPATLSARLGGHVTLEAHADGEHRRLLRWPFGRLGKVQRGRGGSRAGPAHGSAARLVCVRGPEHRQGDSSPGPAIGRARPVGVPPRALATAEQARTRSSSSRRFPIIGRKRRSSAMPTFSSCRGSRTCDGAATRWSWNRRAPARCSEFAIRRLRPPSPCCLRRNKSNGSVGRTVFRGSSFSPCWSIAKSFSRSTPPATAACDRPRVTTTSFFGTFTIFCSTRAARKAGTPIRWAEFIPMPASWLRCRRCGRAGPERKSICARSRPRTAQPISPAAKLLRRTSFDAQLR